MGSDLARVKRCVETLLGITRWPDLELLLLRPVWAAGRLAEFLDGLSGMGPGRVRVVADSAPGCRGLGEAHQRLAGQTDASVLVLLHDDCAFDQPDWLERLVGIAMQPDVAAVAPRFTRDGRVGMLGAVTGYRGDPVYPMFAGLAPDAPGPDDRALLSQEVSVLIGGCTVVRAELFRALGGLDGGQFGLHVALADWCLRARQRGLRVVVTPEVSVHSDEKSAELWVSGRGGQAGFEMGREQRHFVERWREAMASDAAYNPNLTLDGKLFDPEAEAAPCWNPWPPDCTLPRMIGHPADVSGCGTYRLIAPMRALTDAGRVRGQISVRYFNSAELARIRPDTILFQRQVTQHQLDRMTQVRETFPGVFMAFEVDDIIGHMSAKNAHSVMMPVDAERLLSKAARLCDRFYVTTEPVAQYYGRFHPDVRVVPNFLDMARWGGLTSRRRVTRRPRVGWAGGTSHAPDLEVIADVVRDIGTEVEWVFLGMMPEGCGDVVAEFHQGVPIGQYPAKLASLNLDVALAPLEFNLFNEAKSHLRLLEYGILGWPVICTDIFPYQGDWPVIRVRNRRRDWVDAIRHLAFDADEAARMGDALRERVRERWLLENNLDVWLSAWSP